MTVSIDLFKKAMSRFASGVTVVTTRSGCLLYTSDAADE